MPQIKSQYALLAAHGVVNNGAAIFLTISSALITSTIIQVERTDNDYRNWTQQFEALTWSAVAFTYVTVIWKLSDLVLQKEKRKCMLTTGQS
ncbi:hypothetical protein V8E51_001660 [Hyaloscypha variabilis]|uniref:Uncharacterized protein n=1 Tax=Hyaloscypha variabilis (strain UAMH 11265 / GT02V1 / F) TaxID=1149755 RepID=A0A2J6R403_HYAVF|nr:hypothetical protein L207DRAFT_589603 [Hyaloscypha variabilis F]